MNDRTRGAPRIPGIPAWGLAWGAVEATVGHILHLLPFPGLAGAVLFPVGLAFMLAAAKAAESARRTAQPPRLPVSAVPFLVSMTAASVKIVDAVLPGRGWIMAARPALAILAEGLLVSLALAAAAAVRRSIPTSA